MENLEQMEEPLTQPAGPEVTETAEEDRAPAEREISYWLVFAGGLLLYLLSVLPFLVPSFFSAPSGRLLLLWRL